MNNSLLDIEIDGLTNSIQNTISGDSFETEINGVTKIDIKNITQTNGWKFELVTTVIIITCTWWRVRRLIWGKRNFIRACRAIYSPLPVKSLGIKVMKGLSPFSQKPN